MNSIIRIDVFRGVTRTLIIRVEIDDIISSNDNINAVETFFNGDGTIQGSERSNGLDSDLLIDQYFSEVGNSEDEYTVINITQLNPNDLIMFNNLFRSRQPDPYVIEDCSSFIVSDDVEGLTLPVPGFHLDDGELAARHFLRLISYDDDDDDDDDDLGPLPDRIPELRRGVAMRFVEDEDELPLMSQAERTRRQQEIADQMANARQIQDLREEQPFPDCVICGEYLNNVDGPGPSENCQVNCNDVVNVCENNHLFHRGCILTSCNAGRVDIAGQMRSPYYSFEEQSIATECPMCKQPLVPSCEGLRDKERVPTENINEEGLINGGRSRKTRRSRNKGKNKKSMKKGKNKKLVKKGKSMKRVKKVKSMKRRKTMKKRK
jgi:hypothetical protein